MKKLLRILLFSVLSITARAADPAALPNDGFVPLFNEKDLAGWTNVNTWQGVKGKQDTWGVSNGVITCTGQPTGFMRSEKQYENFVFELEWRHLKPAGNSGVFVWASPTPAGAGNPYAKAVEVQILDLAFTEQVAKGGGKTDWFTCHGDVFAIHGMKMIPFPPTAPNPGSSMRAFPSENRTKPSPEWNHYRITAVNGVVMLAVNGKEVSGGYNCSIRKGFLALESEGSPIEFRNLRIKEWPSTHPKPEEIAPLAPITFQADQRYLIFPRAKGLKGKDKVFVKLDGELFFAEYDAVLANANPDFWTYIDLKLHQGKQVTVSAEGPNAQGIALARMSDTIPGKYPLYHEPGRPQIHFSALRGWLNDSSGMFYLNGKWHYYYMNTRFGNQMAGVNNNWSHAVSTDLLHWTEEPMLHTIIRGKQCYWTGSAAVDVENATGLGTPDHPAVVFAGNHALDVPHPFTQCVFVSTDEGMTAKIDPSMMYKPLPKEDERRGDGSRDPMIRWYAPEKKWVMIIYNKMQKKGSKRSFFFFESKDLKNWTETSVLEDMYECPNLIELPLDGDRSKKLWVVWGASTEYRVGSFDGKKFTPGHDGLLLAHHGDYYASQVFDNAPDGRKIQMGWGWVCNYDTEFTQMATFPMELSLKTTPQGPRLFAEFIPELAKLRDGGGSQKDIVIRPEAPLRLGNVSQPMEIDVEFEPGTAKQVRLSGAELNIKWDAATSTVEVQGMKDFKMAADGSAPARKVIAAPQNGRVRLHVLLDIPSVEVVSNGGEHYIIKGRDFKKLGENSPLQIFVEGGDVLFRRLATYPLKSIQPTLPKPN